MLSVLTVLVVLVVLAVLFVAATLATQEGDILRDAPADTPDLGLPVGAVQPEDIAELRFGLAVRGYRMSEVDQVLVRLAHELAGRDNRIAKLEQALADLRALEPVEQGTAVGSPAAEQPVPEQLSPEPGASGQVEPTQVEPTEIEPEGPTSALAESIEQVQATLIDALGEADDAFPEVYLPEPADADLPEAVADLAPAVGAFSSEGQVSDPAGESGGPVSEPAGDSEGPVSEPAGESGSTGTAPDEGDARTEGDSGGARVDGV